MIHVRWDVICVFRETTQFYARNALLVFTCSTIRVVLTVIIVLLHTLWKLGFCALHVSTLAWLVTVLYTTDAYLAGKDAAFWMENVCHHAHSDFTHLTELVWSAIQGASNVQGLNASFAKMGFTWIRISKIPFVSQTAIFTMKQVAHKQSAILIACHAPTAVSVHAYRVRNSEVILQKWLGAGTVYVGRTVSILEREIAVLTLFSVLKRTPKFYHL